MSPLPGHLFSYLSYVIRPLQQEKVFANMRVDLTDLENSTPSKTDSDETSFGALGGFSRSLVRLINSSNVILCGLVVPLTLIAWVWLFLAAQSVASSNSGGTLGPSMQLLEPFLRGLDISTNNAWIAYIISICTPSSLYASVTIQSMTTMFLMWLMMAIAMMLPTAAPMLRTYAEIADTAARKGEPAVPLVVLAIGYLAVWAGFSVQATLLQSAVIASGGALDPSSPVIGFVGGSILILAGLYQFSPLKNACLVKCRNPFTIIFARWSNKPVDIFKLGLQQGLFCLGCCWALMLVMLSVGTMNLVWMAFLTLFTLLEKTGSGAMVTRVFGIVLLAWGLFLVLTSANLTFL